MVEYRSQLDAVFSSLADPTRRDILMRVSKKDLSVSEIAALYPLTIAAISKHLQVLEKAKLVTKKRHGKQQFVSLSPPALHDASRYLAHYRKLWADRLDHLEALLKKQ